LDGFGERFFSLGKELRFVQLASRVVTHDDLEVGFAGGAHAVSVKLEGLSGDASLPRVFPRGGNGGLSKIHSLLLLVVAFKFEGFNVDVTNHVVVVHFNTDVEELTDLVGGGLDDVLAGVFFVDIGGSLDEFVEGASTVFLGLSVFGDENEVVELGVDEFGDLEFESVFSDVGSSAHFVDFVIGAVEGPIEFGGESDINSELVFGAEEFFGADHLGSDLGHLEVGGNSELGISHFDFVRETVILPHSGEGGAVILFGGMVEAGLDVDHEIAIVGEAGGSGHLEAGKGAD
jgi:hypothetical protein